MMKQKIENCQEGHERTVMRMLLDDIEDVRELLAGLVQAAP